MAIYLDHAATTPLLPDVLEAYAEALRTIGNPSSIHGHGQRAKQALEESRERLAAVLGCEPIEVVFTSGGTESINSAIKGLFWAARAADPERTAVVIPGGEHHATVDTVDWLVRAEGARRVEVPLDRDGRVLPERLGGGPGLRLRFRRRLGRSGQRALGEQRGRHHPAGRGARRGGSRPTVPLHVDAVAALGHVPVDFARTRGLVR